MEVINHTVINLIIFILAIYVGYHAVWNVTPALHTPLMAVTSAISAIVIVGAMLAVGLTVGGTGNAGRRALAAVNVFGGFLVTSECWRCSRRKSRRSLPLPVRRVWKGACNESERRYAALSRCFCLLHSGAQGARADAASTVARCHH
jgi:NAD(P) transhydrogenase subunit alpha